jgi:hypothetical protein
MSSRACHGARVSLGYEAAVPGNDSIEGNGISLEIQR